MSQYVALQYTACIYFINVAIYVMVGEHVCQCYGRGKCINLYSGWDNDEFGGNDGRGNDDREKT